MGPRPRHGLSLCAGGGGLDMGLMLAEPGFHTRCYVEWETYPQQCLIAAQRAGYFASAPIWDDVTSFDGKPWRGHIDTILAGYPCQPFSAAGQRKGADDERHLWPDVARIIGEVDPRWVLLENVEGHISLGLDAVLGDLDGMGYRHACGLFSTAETHGSQGRKRVFIVARREGIGKREQNDEERAEPRQRARTDSGGRGLRNDVVARRDQHDASAEWQQCGGELGRDQGDGGDGREVVAHRDGGGRQGHGETRIRWDERNHADRCYPAVVEHQGERRREGRAEPVIRGGRDTTTGAGGAVGIGQRAGSQGIESENRDQAGRQEPHGYPRSSGRAGLSPPRPGDLDAWRAVLDVAPDLAPAASLGDVKRTCDHYAAMVAQGIMAEEETEPVVRRMADALAGRTRTLRLLGNGVDPLTAGHAWRTLALAHGLRPVDLAAGDTGEV